MQRIPSLKVESLAVVPFVAILISIGLFAGLREAPVPELPLPGASETHMASCGSLLLGAHSEVQGYSAASACATIHSTNQLAVWVSFGLAIGICLTMALLILLGRYDTDEEDSPEGPQRHPQYGVISF